jgi:hypothetical protein
MYNDKGLINKRKSTSPKLATCDIERRESAKGVTKVEEHIKLKLSRTVNKTFPVIPS